MLVTRESRQPLARAYPVSDAQAIRPRPAENRRGLPSHGRARLKRKIRIGSLNMGTMTAKSNSLVDLLKRRKIQVLGLQETRWKGAKARPLREVFKLIYNGEQSGKNGVGVILCKDSRGFYRSQQEKCQNYLSEAWP